jgi:hypothetical protein
MVKPVDLFARAARQAEAVMARVTSGQLAKPTPCSEWTVQSLIDHMVGGPSRVPAPPSTITARASTRHW